jgi:hypothetical protein
MSQEVFFGFLIADGRILSPSTALTYPRFSMSFAFSIKSGAPPFFAAKKNSKRQPF